MDGFTFLRILMTQQPTPVIVDLGRRARARTSSRRSSSARSTSSPSRRRASSPELAQIEQELLAQGARRSASCASTSVRERAAPACARRARPRPRARRRRPRRALVVIGASTGGPPALQQIFGALRPAPPAARSSSPSTCPQGFTAAFAERLDRLTPLAAREARGRRRCSRRASCWWRRAARHLELERVAEGSSVVRARARPAADDRYVPSVDRLFESAAKRFGARRSSPWC